jgi:hypothetical protein
VRERIDSMEQAMCANASTQEGAAGKLAGASGTTKDHRRGNFFVRVSLGGIEPVGFRVKSDLRNHQAIVQPRLYDSLMVKGIPWPTFL